MKGENMKTIRYKGDNNWKTNENFNGPTLRTNALEQDANLRTCGRMCCVFFSVSPIAPFWCPDRNCAKCGDHFEARRGQRVDFIGTKNIWEKEVCYTTTSSPFFVHP